jgi:hypothetical protein
MRIIWLFIGGLCLILSACGRDSTPTAEGMVQPSPSMVVPTGAPTFTFAPPLAETPLPSTPPAQPPIPSAPQVPETFAGLVFKGPGGLWRVGPDGEPIFLVDQPDGQLSPDGTRLVYSIWEGNEDVWLVDLATGERRNLTQSPERYERYPQWWPARPEVIVFTSEPGPFIDYGSPTAIRLDGSDYRVLDEEIGGLFALSPDGQTVAFGCCENLGRLYDWDQGSQVFDPAQYGASIRKLYIPSWSPDGRYLVWEVAGDLLDDGRWLLGLAVFDLESKTYWPLHPYEPIGGAMTAHYLSWSPGGDWIAFVAWLESKEFASVWGVRPDGTEEFRLGPGIRPVWSPDGGWLVYTQWTKDLDNGVWAAQAGTWEQSQILPPGYQAVGWIDSPLAQGQQIE